MPVIFQKFIHRVDLQANPDVLYLFGDNVCRKGYGGQAAEMRDEPNAVGVRTKWAPGMTKYDFFSDQAFDEITVMMDQDLEPVREHLDQGGTVVIPLDGLGTGLSKLPTKAPRAAAWLEEALSCFQELGE